MNMCDNDDAMQWFVVSPAYCPLPTRGRLEERGYFKNFQTTKGYEVWFMLGFLKHFVQLYVISLYYEMYLFHFDIIKKSPPKIRKRGEEEIRKDKDKTRQGNEFVCKLNGHWLWDEQMSCEIHM
jgi:hypothetical protein